MKIIVTGGTGFLGRHVVWQLAADGHDVIFTGRRNAEAKFVSDQAMRPVRYVSVDHGTDGALLTMQKCAQHADAMIHCAALASPWGTKQAFWRANVHATHEALTACLSNDVQRFVHISSPSVCFEYRDRIGIREDEPLPIGVNHYAVSKAAAEKLVLAMPLTHRVILRPRAIFGPWDNTLLPRLLRLIRHGRVPLLRGGKALVDMTYISNVVDAVALSIKYASNGSPQIFNITNGEPTEVIQVFGQIAENFGLSLNPTHRPYVLADTVARGLELAARLTNGWEPPFTRYSLATVAFSQTLDLTRARTALGYTPRICLEEGIARTAKWWLNSEKSA